MGFALTSGPKSLKDSFRGVAAQRMLFGGILLIAGMGLIMVTASTQILMPLYGEIGGFSDPAVTQVARFLIGAGFIAAAMVMFALSTETQDAESSPYTIYIYDA